MLYEVITHGVCRIEQDDIDAIGLCFGHPLDGIDEQEGGALIAIGFAKFRKKFLCDPGYTFIQLHLQDLFNLMVLQYFPECAAVATTYDDHLPWIGMGKQGWMTHHLVINKIIVV